MKLFGFLYMVAGGTLALLILRAAHGNWSEFGQIALFTAIPNSLTGLLAYFLFRRGVSDRMFDLVLLVACYAIGIGGGVYFYYS